MKAEHSTERPFRLSEIQAFQDATPTKQELTA